MAEEKTVEKTKVEKVDVNLDEIFGGAPGAESVTVPEEETKKPNMFSRKEDMDMSFVEAKTAETEEEEVKEEVKEEETAETKTETKTEVKEPVNIDEVLGVEEDEDEEAPEQKKRGRKPITGVSDVFKKLIDDEKLLAFDDGKELDEYTAKDWQELIQANLDERTRTVRKETPKQFFQSLPEELQVAARYVADGGKDLKNLFGALAQVEEVRELDPKSVKGQERIVRDFLNATGFGTREEIEEEIEIWKDLGKLEKQAMKFKPKLDKMQEKVVARKLQEQDMKKKQQEHASKTYMKNVFNTLRDGKVGDIKIDKKTQSLLYNGLVNPAYPSISGQNTNLLGHLLEKYQFVEPNYPLITEALWLLADPKGYKSNIMKKGANRAVADTVRKLKTAQSNKTSSSQVQQKESSPQRKSRRTIPRGNNIFKRM
tara:strand:- start:539 stop:1822 length:1284 start_codon:yes stop_codon:yes gene_type:complete